MLLKKTKKAIESNQESNIQRKTSEFGRRVGSQDSNQIVQEISLGLQEPRRSRKVN